MLSPTITSPNNSRPPSPIKVRTIQDTTENTHINNLQAESTLGQLFQIKEEAMAEKTSISTDNNLPAMNKSSPAKKNTIQKQKSLPDDSYPLDKCNASYYQGELKNFKAFILRHKSLPEGVSLKVINSSDKASSARKNHKIKGLLELMVRNKIIGNSSMSLSNLYVTKIFLDDNKKRFIIQSDVFKDIAYSSAKEISSESINANFVLDVFNDGVQESVTLAFENLPTDYQVECLLAIAKFRFIMEKDINYLESKKEELDQDNIKYLECLRICAGNADKLYDIFKYKYGDNRLIFARDNEELYCGEIINKKYNGKGILIGPNFVYEGSFIEGNFSGFGNLIVIDKTENVGIEYIGNFTNSLIEQGFYKRVDQNSELIFRGTFKNKIPNLGKTEYYSQDENSKSFLIGQGSVKGNELYKIKTVNRAGEYLEGKLREGEYSEGYTAISASKLAVKPKEFGGFINKETSFWGKFIKKENGYYPYGSVEFANQNGEKIEGYFDEKTFKLDKGKQVCYTNDQQNVSFSVARNDDNSIKFAVFEFKHDFIAYKVRVGDGKIFYASKTNPKQENETIIIFYDKFNAATDEDKAIIDNEIQTRMKQLNDYEAPPLPKG